MSANDHDVIIIGSGAGGATIARALAEQGRKVLVLERGDYVPREDANWSAREVFQNGRYVSPESWLDKDGHEFQPQVHYGVGGATKHYGAALFRMTPEDFREIRHPGGISPAWAVSYEGMAPFYSAAEKMYHVHGSEHYPALDHDPVIARLSEGLAASGLHPEAAPSAVIEGTCVRCSTCDGFPCKVLGKGDAEACGIIPALATGNVTLVPNTQARYLLTGPAGEIIAVQAQGPFGTRLYFAPVIVLAAGAVNSAALWLRSGLPDSSDQVGRNYMCHSSQAVLAIGREKIPRGFHKTLRVMDHYYDSPYGYPLGSIQMAGQPSVPMLRGESRLAEIAPKLALREIAERSLTFWLMSEDLPRPGNRVTVENGQVKLSYTQEYPSSSSALYSDLAYRLPALGYGMHLRKRMPLAAVAHQCGTLRMSASPLDGPVSPTGEAWEVPGLYVADASVFPSSGAVNPALTVMAHSLRCAAGILRKA